VKQHGGGIHVQSEPRKGTRFEICFPRTDALPVRKIHEAPHTSHTGAETVIVVEDQEQLRTLVCRQLRSAGHTVLDARDGASAIRIASGHPGVIHLLVTDVVLPGMNGRELFDRLALERPGLKVLFMSGYAGDILSAQGVATEGLDLLQKPFSLQDLAAKVQQVLRRT
jgi:DNA-binding response OmpR family regulator